MEVCKYIVIIVFWVRNFIYSWKAKFIRINGNFGIIKYRTTKGIPVIVKDLKINESLKYLSVAEVARLFDTYPEKIWRVIRKDKLYLDRYQIRVNSYINIDDIEFYIIIIILYIKCFKFIFKKVKNNVILITYVLLWIIIKKRDKIL